MPRAVSNSRYAATPDFLLSDSALQYQIAPVVAALSGGGFVALWHSSVFGSEGVIAQIFDHNGREVGDEFIVDGDGIEPAVAALASGGFIVTWSEESPHPDVFDIKARIFDANGTAVDSEFAVNTTTVGFQVESRVTELAGGGFAVTWLQRNDGTFDNIRGQVFTADGTKIGAEFIANDASPGTKEEPDVIALAGGGFVIAWSSVGAETQGGNLSTGSRAQLFDAAGAKVGSAFSLNTIVPGVQQSPDLAALPSGGFVAVWVDDGGAFGGDPHPENKGIWAQIFDANGAKVGDDIHVSTLGPFGQDSADVEIIPGVGFMVIWREGNSTAENGAGHLRAQIIDFDGNKSGEEFAVTPGFVGGQQVPDLAVLANGALAFAWQHFPAPQTGDDVRAQIFFPTTLGTAGDDVIGGTPDRDFIFGLQGNDQLTGDGEDDGLDGGAGSDVLNGGGGNDELDGGADGDAMSGGTGNDLYLVDDAGDTVTENAGEGVDAVRTSVSFALGAGSEVETLAARDAAATTAIDLTGNAVAQFLYGNAGANVLDGGGGGDRMEGFGGDDRYFVRAASDSVVEAFDGGFDRVLASASWTLTANSHVEMLTTDDNLATTAIDLTGNSFSQFIYGNAGSNRLDSGGGGFAPDVMYGFEGDDFFVIRQSGDRAVEAVGGGFDRVLAATSFVLQPDSEVEMITTINNLSTSAISLTGNAYSQYLYGNAGANTLDGGGGGDVMYGFGGNDRFFIRDSADRVVEAASGGSDRVFAGTSFTLEAGSHVEMITTDSNLATTAINLTGNELFQYLYGNAGVNEIDGGGGGDVMYGFEGDDRFYIRNASDRVVEFAGGGANDRVFAAASFTLETGSEVELFTTIDNLSTAAINLTGNALSQYLYGNAGVNVLDGGGGGDVMYGFEGDDFFVTRNASDRVVEFAGGGANDRVFAGASFTLEAGSEVELFTTFDNLATTAINLTGNELAQYMYGNAGANTLDGKSGADVMTGFGGADNFAFTSTLGGGNVDRIGDFSSADDTIQLDDAVFAGLALGALSANAFVIGSQAADADDRIIYNQVTGALLFDADGSGGASAAVQFATLDAAPLVNASDFTVI